MRNLPWTQFLDSYVPVLFSMLLDPKLHPPLNTQHALVHCAALSVLDAAAPPTVCLSVYSAIFSSIHMLLTDVDNVTYTTIEIEMIHLNYSQPNNINNFY